ncbi:MAG: helix-turn-helix domain-containing protein [Spirochaetaceae bacterium]|jgi:transcriptional regulator with XRE-family HTH domain|nr:helix-turn-helix domain-containing protein [Spirochaetaceae bacterium]
MGFAENLRAELDFQGIIVKELAARTKISVNTLHHYLHGKKCMPPADAACKIAAALGVTVEYLVGGGQGVGVRGQWTVDRAKSESNEQALVGSGQWIVDRAGGGSGERCEGGGCSGNERCEGRPVLLEEVLSKVAVLSECWERYRERRYA